MFDSVEYDVVGSSELKDPECEEGFDSVSDSDIDMIVNWDDVERVVKRSGCKSTNLSIREMVIETWSEIEGTEADLERFYLGRCFHFLGYHVQITPLDSRTQGRDVTENDHSYFLLFLYYLPFSSPIHTTDCRLMLGPELYSTYQILNQNYIVHILYI